MEHCTQCQGLPTFHLPQAAHLAPLGPCITTKDEIENPHHLQVDGELRVNYITDYPATPSPSLSSQSAP